MVEREVSEDALAVGERDLFYSSPLFGSGGFFRDPVSVARNSLWGDMNTAKSPRPEVFQGFPKGESAWMSVFQGSPQWDRNWDRRDPASYVKPKNTVTDSNNNVDPGADSGSPRNDIEKMTPHASRHIFLIRHGHYNINGEADHERGLTELGREQASLTGVRLRALNLPYKLLVRSTMKRALETAELIMKEMQMGNELDVRESDLLREGAPIPPEPPVGHWRPEKHQFFEDGARIEAAFRKYFHRAEPTQEGDSYEILVCHANVIRYFVCRALQFPPEGWLRMNLHHGSVTWITIRPSGRVVLQSLGDAGHIPPDKLSSSSCNVTPAAVDADDSENTDNLTARVTEQDSLAAPGATQLDELDLPQRAELSSQDALTPADLPANVDCVGVFQFPVENVNEALVQWLSAKVENARRTRKESRVGVFVIGVEEERGMMGDRCRRDCWNRRFERKRRRLGCCSCCRCPQSCCHGEEYSRICVPKTCCFGSGSDLCSNSLVKLFSGD